MKEIGLQDAHLRWRIALLALVLLAGSQLTIAEHQFSHDDLVTDACGVCLKLDQLDEAVPAAGGAPIIAVADRSTPCRPSRRPCDRAAHPYQSRAPPAI